jgi:diaminohydroxyphosphoribosylaminopyrimidine deaminase/5-amino-6-(5-phosphoribosylamino)uracil reductase
VAAPDFDSLMREAIALALRGRGAVEPNPRVGALALEDGAVVGRGWHRAWGAPHAEVEALADAARAGARPDTVVVTLEPCSTPAGVADKKTPPCTQALLDARVRRIVIGARDPDPRHGGAGIEALAAAGVEVREGVLAGECEAINRPFRRWLGLQRPWTIAKWAMTLDGKTACPTGEARWISGAQSRTAVHELRTRVDAVVIGYRTARIDDPMLNVRHAQGPQPVRIVVDPRAEIADDSRLVASARELPLWLLVHAQAEPLRTGHLQDLGVHVLHVPPAGDGHHLDLAWAWRELRRRGLRRVMVEGGGRLVARLLDADCVDQVLCFVAPKIVGGQQAPTAVAGAGKATMAQALQLTEPHWHQFGDDVAIGAFVG